MLTAAAVLLAAGLHRIGGMGFALIAMPVLIMILGPENGMRLGLTLGLMVSLVALAQTWRSVDPKVTMLLALPALVSIPVGAFVARTVSPPVLLIAVGTLLAVLLLTGRLLRPAKSRRSFALALSTGLLAGFIHALSGLSAPLLTAYAITVNWQHRSFLASAQVVFICFNLASLLAWGWSSTVTVQAVALSPVLVLGVLLGALINRFISGDSAMIVTLTVAWGSALGAVIKGVVVLMT